jgi:FMN reductase
MKLVAILGSVTPPGRLLTAVKWTLDDAEAANAGLETHLINLGEQRVAFADGRRPEQYGDDTAAIVRAALDAHGVILATPVYRGSFTGALKNILDHLPLEALAGKPVGIIAMGATSHHYLGADWHLRDVLAWFGALAIPTSVYLTSNDFVDGAISESAKQDLRSLAAALVKLRDVSPERGDFIGPRPLAARRN